MPSPNPRELKAANLGANLRPRSASRDLRASLRSPGKNGSQFDDSLRAQLNQQNIGATGKSIRVFPAKAEFRDTEVNVTHVLSITVVNRSDKVKRIRFKPPTTTVFTLHQIPSTSVAPGLEITADLEFLSTTEGDFSDELVVMCEDDTIRIPVRAFAPHADIFFDGFCHFGGVAPASTTIRYVDIVNRGSKTADFKFVTDQKVPQFEIDPLFGRLGPAGSDDCFMRLRVTFNAGDLGVNRSVAKMEVNSVVIGTTLDMSALVVRQKVELVSPDGAGRISTLTFGTVYFGEQRSNQILFVNDGPQSIEYSSTVPKPEDVEEDTGPVFSITPASSSVVGFEQKMLSLSFHPPPLDDERGWKQASIREPVKMDYPSIVPFVCSGQLDPKLLDDMRSEVKLVGRAVSVQVSLSVYDWEFIAVPQYEHADMNLTIKNHSDELPIAFTLAKRVAHFRCKPATGRLLPQQSMTLVLTFQPNQIGSHSGELDFVLRGASGTTVGRQTVTVRGMCNESERTRKIPGGLLATKETFETPLQCQPMEQLAKQKQTLRPKFVREKCWVKFPPEVTPETVKFTMQAHEFEKIHEGKEEYISWLRTEQAKRRAKQVITQTASFALGNSNAGVASGDAKEDPDYAKPSLDMGMFSLPVKGAPGGLALSEPKLSLSEVKEDPLYLKSDHGIKTVLKPRSRILDEDRLIINKFKPHPTTGKEKRDCQLHLSAKNILQVSCFPSKMIFGAVCIDQKTSKSFTVSNDTQNSILVRIDTHNNPLLSQSKPESQVIPPRGTAGFDIVLFAANQMEISTKFTYIINEVHEYEVPISAEAVPVMLSLNKNTLQFIFPPQSFSPSVSESIILVNQGNTIAEFSMTQGQCFTTIPAKGTVEATSSQEIVVNFKPGVGTFFQETLAVEVVGGSPLELKCSGDVPEGGLKVKTKALDFGSLAAGVTLRKSMTIVGDAESDDIDTVWYVEHSEIARKCPGLSVHPEHGALAKGASTSLVATMRSERAQKLDTFFQIMVRGGKPIKVKVKCEVVVPVAKVLNDEIDFGSTYLGACSVQQLKIKNESHVDAIFTLDLRQHFEFGFTVPEELEFEDEEAIPDVTSGTHSLMGLKTMQSSKNLTSSMTNLNDVQDEAEGPLSKFRVPPKSEVAFEMTYAPVALMSHAFELPISLQGLPSNAAKQLKRAVCAESGRPRLLLSMSNIDFGTNIVVSEQMGKFAYHLSLNVTNCDDKPCSVQARLHGEAANKGNFQMQPLTTELAVSRACTLNVDFVPRKQEQYKCKLQIFVDGQTEPYFDLPVHGMGVHPTIKFDRREVFLPPTPVGIPLKTSFFVINNGFDNLNLRYQIDKSSMHLPISVAFPLGTMLNVVKQRLPVEVTISTEQCCSFTASINFFDSSDHIYTILLVFTADSSLTTLFPWLSLHEGHYMVHNKSGKCPAIEMTSELMELDFDTSGNISRKIPGSPVLGSPSRSQPSVVPNAGFLCACKMIVNDSSISNLLEFCNTTLFKQALSNFPADIHEERGKMIIDVIEQGTGKPIPGQIKKIAATRKEEASQTLNYYSEMCNALKMYGAMLALVRPDYLLPFHLFEKLYLDGKSAEAASYSTETLEFLESHFELVHKASWLIVIYQVLRLFVLSRFTPKSIKSLAGVDKAFPPLHTTGSNLYSANELCLLAWLSYHYAKIYPTDKMQITNFDKDLHDCRIFAAAIISHVPTTLERFSSMKKSENVADHLANAKRLRQVMLELNLDYRPSEDVLTSAPGRDLVFFVVYLVDALPGFIPKTTITFDGRLNEAVVQTIELTNPSSRPLIYNVHIDGSPEFSAADSLKIAPRDKIKFPVTCLHQQRTPAIGDSTAAQIFFIGERVPGSPMGATLVFNLKSEVKSFKRTALIIKETKLYEQIAFEVPCENKGDSDTEMTVTLVNLNNWPEKKPGAKGKKVEVTSSSLLPKMTFWLKKSKFKLKKKSSGSVTVSFLPLRLAAHSCLVFVKDEVGLEQCFELRSQVSLPNNTDTFKFAHVMKSTIVKDVPLSVKNPALDRCRQAVIEIMGKTDGGAFLKACSDETRIDYKVEFMSQGFSGPRELTLWGKNPPAQLEKGLKVNHLQLELHPQGVGKYVSRVCLRSALDVRILDIEAKVTSLGTRAELTLSVPARQQIVQEIPVINKSENEWRIVAELQGDGFSGPSTLTVKPKETATYPLTFKPSWICNMSGLLVLRNQTADDKYEYTLTGIGEDPVAEDHVVVECKARKRAVVTIPVRNILQDQDCEYHIECDLIGMSGDSMHMVPLGGNAAYELVIKMPRGGHFTGSISFVAPNKQFIWFTVEIQAENPPSERTVELESRTRSAVAADITIINPLDSEVTFDVLINGPGLFGEPNITLAPHETAIFELIYSPLIEGSSKGGLTFLNDVIGEFWYALELTALAADPIVLEEMQCEVGKTVFAQIELENPLGEDIEFEIDVSNTVNFQLVDSTVNSSMAVHRSSSRIAVKAYSTQVAYVIYTSSALSEEESAVIKVHHHEAGVWEYHCSGRGFAPESAEKELRMSSTVGNSVSSVISFRNPFKAPLLCNYVLSGEVEVPEDAQFGAVPAFRLAVGQINNVVLKPFETVDLPIVFVPNRMTGHDCQLQIHAVEHGFKWEYPIVGTAEAAIAVNLGRIFCKARESLQEHLDLDLAGASDLGEHEKLDIEVVTPAETSDMLSRCLTIERDIEKPRPAPGVCRLMVVFEPLKATRCKIQILVTRASGGRWRFDMELVASSPDVDDTIRIEGNVNVSSSVSFRLTNQFDSPAAFQAYFSLESPPEFTVTPESGMLEPYGSEGTNFVVSFTPKIYGKFYQGKIIVETEEMQWTYEVHGNLPRYEPPRGSGKVDTWIPPEADPDIYKNRLPVQNYMQQNVQSVRHSQTSLQPRSPAKGDPLQVVL